MKPMGSKSLFCQELEFPSGSSVPMNHQFVSGFVTSSLRYLSV